MQWCEFCWSVRKLFDKCGIACRSVDLDSVQYQEDGWGIGLPINWPSAAPALP
ncbi:MAG: glutaredoxin domain-containing protein [Pseudomonadota bacterium]